jgi:hypothetical protein
MSAATDKARRERAYLRLFHESFTRLRKRGLSEYRAGRIAKEVAERSLQRLETPEYESQQQFAQVVGRVCSRLSEGVSYYTLIGEMPYLATARIDRVVAIANRTDPPVEPEIAAAAKRSTRVERLSAVTALLFMGLALGALGVWWAIGIGAVVAVAGEFYIQVSLPPRVRRAVADVRAPLLVSVAAAAVLIYFGYHWITEDDPRPVFVLIAAFAAIVSAFVLPGVTIARLVSVRERKFRRALEQKLIDADERTPKD